ncbi:MAG: phosphoribosylglycinamide formyltransferase [candidate division FCPU426 bacterium]
MVEKKRVAFLASGGGSNLQALLNAMREKDFPALPVLLVSNKKEAFALERGRNAGLRCEFVDPKLYPSREDYDAQVLALLRDCRIDLVCLAGYMRILSPLLVRAYAGRILNIHPALLPKFGGEGMFGHHVHQAVLDAKETESGASVHFVDEGVDSGVVVAQARVPVLKGDSVETLAKRVLEAEHLLYPQALRKVCEAV